MLGKKAKKFGRIKVVQTIRVLVPEQSNLESVSVSIYRDLKRSTYFKGFHSLL
jgi:hypothetical protein